MEVPWVEVDETSNRDNPEEYNTKSHYPDTNFLIQDGLDIK